jgi:uncharacterized protein (TIGR02680 family)
MTAPDVQLPEAFSARWQPLRSGLFNLYKYDYEEFRFEEGRLLLRGNNGTGKSRVLALQLPFLLDGETAPHRFEPDADPAKHIEWNLLMGKLNDRLGYTWIEFGRRDTDGTHHYLTLGCGLQANEGRPVQKWFFVTPKRIGKDLFLQSASGSPLSKERLTDVLHEQVFTTATAYRREIDVRLFGLGTHRYDALMNILIQLRQPQLSRHLDEKRLSNALSEALPPLSANVIGDVAESFRSLEAERISVAAFREARQGVASFLTQYERYAQIAARRRAERVRHEHSQYEASNRELRRKEQELTEKLAAGAAASAEVDRLQALERQTEVEVHTLASSPQMRAAQSLQDARTRVTDRTEEERRAKKDYDLAVRASVEREEAAERSRREAETTLADARRYADDARARATECGLGSAHATTMQSIDLDTSVDETAVKTAAKILDAVLAKRLAAAKTLQASEQSVATAESSRRHAQETMDRRTADLEAHIEARTAADETLTVAVTALLDEYQRWRSQLLLLSMPPIEDLGDDVEAWAEALLGRSPIAVATSAASDALTLVLARERAEAEGQLKHWRSTLVEQEEERTTLASGRHIPPPAPNLREDRFAFARAGVPMWSLCDFAPTLSENERAGLEAALESAGLLDALVTPDGSLLEAGQHDTVLSRASNPEPPDDGHLGLLLVPCIDSNDQRATAIGATVVGDVLRSIGSRANVCTHWIDPNGTWQLGPLSGAATKQSAEHIGNTAREARRRARVAELERAIAQTQESIRVGQRLLEDVSQRQKTASAEVSSAPVEDGVRAARVAIDECDKRIAGSRQDVAIAEAQLEEKQQDHERAKKYRDEVAVDLGLEAWVGKVEDLREAIAIYRGALAGLWPTLRTHATTARQHATAASQAEGALAERERRHAALLAAKAKTRDATAECEVLEKSIGAETEQILRQLTETRDSLDRYRGQRKTAETAGNDAQIAVGLTRKDIEVIQGRIAEQLRRREDAITALGRFIDARLLSIAVADLGDTTESWSITRAVDVSRRIETALAGIDSDDAAWERNSKTIFEHIGGLNDALLPHGYSPLTSSQDNVVIVTVPFMGRSCTMSELRDALDEELASRQAVLNAREREILENHLIGEVSSHLHELLRSGERLVQDMNDELGARPMSTGMTLRFIWEPVDDGPAGLSDARRLLLRAGGTWSTRDRETLGAFLQEQIQSVRAAQQTGTWQEHLSTALDYRAWHRFSVERQQDGQWKRLTKRTHGTGSGGEKAIALTIPQFAAAAAHYRSAHPQAPRLILLDEAFVGVDSDMRSKCMGLLKVFDLDFVMTSEREWGCYPTLPGVAIHQLAAHAGIDAVGITRWIWNGRERVRAEIVLPPAAPSEESAPTMEPT